MHSPKHTHTLRSLLMPLTSAMRGARKNLKNSSKRGLTIVALVALSLVALPGYFAVRANTLPSVTNFLSSPMGSMSRGMGYFKQLLFGVAPVKPTLSAAACNLTQQITVTGCYFTGGSSKATVSVEVGWTGAVNGDTITVSLDGGAQTRIIKPESLYDPGSGSAVAGPIVSPEVVAFEITADGLAHTITSTLSGSSSCSVGPNTFNAPAACMPNFCSAGELGGTIYFDFNGDGIRQSGELLGVPNVTVSAYDSSNTLVGTATSGSDGRYEFSAANGNAIAAGSYPLRLEVTNLPASGFKTTTRMGANNGSSVQFVSAAQCNLDVSVIDQNDYCQDNPTMVLPCYTNGDPLPAGDSGDSPALIALPYNSSGVMAGEVPVATGRQVGSLWGVAYNKFTNKTFSAAMLKRHVGLGPLGLGGLYVTNMSTLTTTNFVDVTTLGVDVGQASVPSNAARGLVTTKLTPSHDTTVYPLIGKVGIGDIDISEDGNTLYFVNLNDKKLYSIDITAYNTSNTLPTAANVTSTPIPSVQPCVAGTTRPFGTGVFQGKVYVGAVCDAFGGSRSSLRASVFAYDPVGASWSTIFTFPLTYPKGYPNQTRPDQTGWNVWTDTFSDYTVFQDVGSSIAHPEPLLSDIVFDVDGTMVLGFADRASLQLGFQNYSPDAANSTRYSNFVGGDILRAYFSNGAFVLENNAKAGPNTGFAPGNNQGPGFGEYYDDKFSTCCHTETMVGGLALKPGSGEVVAVTMDPVPGTFFSEGVRTFNNFTGAAVRNFAVYANSNGDGLFGKAAGLGDIELACGKVNYLELGNRVWMDNNQNGIQDSNEPALAGVTVHLYQQGNNTPVATAVTDANGNYRFTSITDSNGNIVSDSNLTDSVGLVASPGLLPNTNYIIRFDSAADYQSGGALYGKRLSTNDAGGGTFGTVADLRDSDAVTGNNYGLPGASYPEILVRHLVSGVPTLGTGQYGEVDHTMDAGFYQLLDFGDAPDPTYPTLLASNGARHVIIDGVYLGARVDNEADGQPSANDDGDDNNGTPDDEDGVVLPLLIGGQTVTVKVTASVPGRLNGWIDFNRDGDWNDAGEQVFNDTVVNAGVNMLTVTVPLNATIGTTHTRFRFTTTAGVATTVTGQAPDGEVEDYPGLIVAGYSLGNRVWRDVDNSGTINAADGLNPGIDGVQVDLLDSATLQPVKDIFGNFVLTQQTHNGGYYRFDNLAKGSYIVEIRAVNFQTGYPLENHMTSTGAFAATGPYEPAPNPSPAIDSDDNGTFVPVPPNPIDAVVRSGVVTLGGGNGNQEPTGETDLGPGDPGPFQVDSTSNLTIDFGFVPKLNLGNFVWKDINNNGQVDAGEAGIANVLMQLYRDDGTTPNTFDGSDTLVTTVLTGNNGIYSFTGLYPGRYFVRVAPSNFVTPGGVLVGCFSSTITQPNADGNVDNDDNGIDNAAPQTNGILSGPVTLYPFTEPPANVDTDGTNGNLTVDFGFYASLNLGNLVWKDENNNGLRDNTEPGIDGVTMQLYLDNGNNVLDGGDTQVGTTTTQNGGLYNFTGLAPGNYFVRVAASNFTGAGVLTGCLSSTPTVANPNTDVDNDDNGVDDANFTTNGIASGLITLTANGEPPANVDGDGTSGNLTIDFGFYPPMNLGNLVWKDYNNNGLKDAGEPGMDNVIVELIRDANNNGQPDDAVVTSLTTSGGGFYNFTNLLPGNYFVRVAASNFVSGGALFGCLSSTVTTANPNSDVDNDDNGIDNPTPGTGGVTSGLVTLIGATEPPAAVDGDGTNGNLTVDFGFYAPMNLGNLIFKDYNNNGLKDASEPGMDGVVVQLIADANNNGQPDDAVIATQTTSGGGFYNFSGLLPGNYFVRVAASNFVSGGALFGCLSSTTTNPNPNSDVDNDDNGIDNPAPQNGGVLSNIITLIGNSEPTTDGDGPNGNLTLDFGFYSVLKLGNLVWKDTNNNGIKDAAEAGIDNVRVELYADRNNNNTFEPNGADGPLVAFTITSGGGFYQFTGLLPGNYFVLIAPLNFQTGQPLAGCFSSIPTNANPNSDVDNDDNGIDSANPIGAGIASGLVTLTGQGEPDVAVDGDDKNGNQTVDFGFYPPLNLGNLIFKDDNNNGLKDANEPGIDGVVVELIADANNNNIADDAVIATTTTLGGGLYNFTGLPVGSYFVRVAASNFTGSGALAGCLSSTTTVANPNSDIDNDDNGIDNPTPGTGGVVSGKVDLTVGGEPTNDGDGNNGNLTVDFGFYPPMNLGNLVWKDYNNNGLKDAGEPGMDGVLVQLIADANNNNLPDDAVVATLTTSGGGLYNFTNLLPGNYFVRVAASNFTGAGALVGCLSSTTTNANPNSDVDNDDNGVDNPTPGTNGITSGVVTLLGFAEPGPQVDGDGTNGNLTVDFGFYAPMNLGNLVWKDLNNNGLKDATEAGVDNVLVELIRDVNNNGQPDDAVVTTTTTAGGGLYSFTNLVPGTYFVRVAASNFTGAGALVGCLSSEPTETNPNDDVDNNDDGLNNPTPGTNGIVSGAITLVGNTEPTNDGDGPNGNNTVDFGFIPLMNLGNLVWKDYNNNGLKDAGEPGMDNVVVELMRDANNNGQPDDTVIATQTTSGGGLYNFLNLPPGNYIVRIAGSNFTGAGALTGCLSSTTTVANPNSDVDNDDNGVDNPTPATGGVSSGVVTLTGHGEPTTDGDGDNGNLTVDFGFYTPLSLGNAVWKDLNNDGLFNNNEPGVNGVVLQLYRETNGSPGLQIGGDTLVGTTTTANGGLYQFTGLLPGDYYVFVPSSNLTGNGALAGCASSTVDATNPNNDVDNDDNGLPGPNGGVVTGVVTLTGNGEPTNDGDGPNGNQTVDLGFYPPVNLGNLVWKDLNNNGVKDANEPGVDGVVVELIRDANNNNTLDDAVVATLTTSGGGLYNFTNLQPGNYFVRVAASNFNGAGVLTGCLSSEPTATNPNNDVDNDDNGLNSPTPATGGIASGLVTLTGHGEPTTDGDGDSGNLTVDFGFIPLMNLGNLIWKDNNNGLKDASEPGMNGVTVVLYRDTNGNNQLDLATDTLVGTTTTATVAGTAGQYSFANLPPGNYFVYLPSSNFTGAGALAGCLSSTVDATNPNNDVDNDDNGLTGPNGGVVTGVIILTGHGEPTNDGDGDNGNLTVDLGFYSPMNLGNLVWKDENNDGLRQPAEAGIDGVLLELFKDANNNGIFEEVSDTPVATQTTAGGGLYNFTNLTPGVYFVRVAKSNFQPNGTLAGCLSSSTTASNPDNDVDNDDNGLDTPPSAVGIISNAITLVSGSEPTNDGDGANGNLTLDFGFYAPLTLGNLVWKDNNNNGLRDAGEAGIDGVTVELIRDANNNNLPDDAVVTTTNTTGGGFYSFTNLQPGNYFVRIAAINFQGANSLAGCVSSTTTNANPNSDIDNDDNGIDNPNPQTNGIVSGVITLAGNTEPPAAVDGDGINANETVDFGFYAPVNLGNLVWKDNNNNGLRDAGEPGVDGVVIELFRDTNNSGVFEPGTDLSAGTTTTAGGGLYGFTNLVPGNYFVRVAPINFQSGGALFGCSSSSVTNPTPNSDIDNDDNGIDNPTPQTNGILSGLVTLAGNSEPPVAVDGDGPNGNLTVDFGFISGALSIGNLIWKDANANGLHEASEPGIANVKVELIRDANNNNLPDDAVVQTVTTNAQGIYLFTGLAPGNYFVRVAASNFIPGGALYGCVGSPGNNPPNSDADNDDNGSDSNNPASNPPVSGIVTLTQGGEPTNDGDGGDSNQTVDMGFITPIMTGLVPVPGGGGGNPPCIGPGSILQVETTVVNAGATTQQNNPGPEVEVNLPPILAAVAGSCTTQGGNGTCAISGTGRVTWDGSLAPGERLVLRYKVQIANTALPGAQYCVTTLANFDADNNGSNETQLSATTCGTVTCLAPGPGLINPGCSVLIYPVYTSSSTNPNAGNTRVNLTNADPNNSASVHLFFVDGTSCSVNDAYVCLTANQTTSFLASDLDPGVTGYIIAVAVDQNGCPTNFNHLLGDEYVKFDTGHYGNLTADCAMAIPGGTPACQVGTSTVSLNFDGVSYSQLPQTVAVDNLPDRASGNDTMLILDRISGNLATGMDKLGAVLGLLYNDTETAYSFTFTPNTCQFRSSLSNTFPRTAPRYETVIPSGRSGWMKLSSVGTALSGATLNRNPNSVGSGNAFNGAHSTHTITLNPSVSVTMPVFPPSC